MEKISWTPQERKVLDLILQEENKKAFIKECCKLWGVARFYTMHSTTGWQMLCFWKYRLNPAFGDKVLAIGRAFHQVRADLKQSEVNGSRIMMQVGWTSEDQLDFYVKLLTRFGKRIEKRIETILTNNRSTKGWQQNTITQDLKELLARGFIHYEDADFEGDEYDWAVRNPATNLVWPKLLTSKALADDILVKWGIPGTIIYKVG